MTIQASIVEKIEHALIPEHVEVINESHMHNVPDNSETHFKIVCVSKSFEGQRRVARHQMLYGLLSAELEGCVHALALHLYSPEEWGEVSTTPNSPNCMGGE